MKKINLPLAVLAIFITGTYALVANAGHAWGKYHWDISSVSSAAIPLELVDNLTGIWTEDFSLKTASARGNTALQEEQDLNSVLTTEWVNGVHIPDRTSCEDSPGVVEVCNVKVESGWLGLAPIWATRGRSNHIVRAVVKVNDFYFDQDFYNSKAWRDYVMCQEVGHTFGLNHQNTEFDDDNLGTCMDYTDDPTGNTRGGLSNISPNVHDYDQMVEIYAHLNSTDGGGGGKGKGKKSKNAGDGAAIDLNNPSEWGQAIGQDASGQNNLFERNLPNGQVLVTHVLWAN